MALTLAIALTMENVHALETDNTRFAQLDTNGNLWHATSNTAWACVHDHHTGLTWEIKTPSGLRAASHTYTVDVLTTTQSVAHCATHSCNTLNFIADVNATSLCGARDWRLPTREELRTLIDYTRPHPGPTINTDLFPNTIANFYWSATPDASDTHSTWGLGFTHGFDYAYPKENAAHLRLVRGKPLLTETRFAINDGSTVRDKDTGLLWQRCSVGQHWNGSTCADATQPMTFAQAQIYAQQHHPWRLPTLAELIGTVDLEKYSPAVNASQFPNTALRSYWTATPFASNTHLQWCVNFMYGDSYADDATANAYVKLVRDATLDH